LAIVRRAAVPLTWMTCSLARAPRKTFVSGADGLTPADLGALLAYSPRGRVASVHGTSVRARLAPVAVQGVPAGASDTENRHGCEPCASPWKIDTAKLWVLGWRRARSHDYDHFRFLSLWAASGAGRRARFARSCPATCDPLLRIPMAAGWPSLNVSAAAPCALRGSTAARATNCP